MTGEPSSHLLLEIRFGLVEMWVWCVSQELCYVCMQRAQRNLALSRSDERSRVLMLPEHQRDLQYFQKEEVPKLTLLSIGISHYQEAFIRVCYNYTSFKLK